MGTIQCSSSKLDTLGMIEKSLENKNTPLETRIHNEYLYLKDIIKNTKDKKVKNIVKSLLDNFL